MKIIFHKNFVKDYSKLRKNEKKRFKERRDIFVIDSFNQTLNNHALSGKYSGYRSINVGGNLRAVFKLLTKEVSLFVAIDTHGNLYE